MEIEGRVICFGVEIDLNLPCCAKKRINSSFIELLFAIRRRSILYFAELQKLSILSKLDKAVVYVFLFCLCIKEPVK